MFASIPNYKVADITMELNLSEEAKNLGFCASGKFLRVHPKNLLNCLDPVIFEKFTTLFKTVYIFPVKTV